MQIDTDEPDHRGVPYDIMGTGVASDAARNYVMGTTYGRTRLSKNVFAGDLHGQPFSTWAGAVSIATGQEVPLNG